MQITLHSTDRIVTILKGGAEIPARIWEGQTESGIKVQVLVTRITAHADQDLSQFEAELTETHAPSAEVQAFPLRMIL